MTGASRDTRSDAALDGVDWVRLVFVDVFGALHSVQLPGARFADAVAAGAPFDGSALEGRARHLEADMLLRPDPDSIVRLSGGLARAACTVLGPDGSAWPGDPRTALTALRWRFPGIFRIAELSLRQLA